MALLCAYLILNTCENAELTLNCYVKLVCVLYNLLCEGYVLLVWEL